MVLRRLGSIRKGCLTALGLSLAILTSGSEAQARHHHSYVRYVRMSQHIRTYRHIRHGAPVDSPRFSAMVVDANSGRTLYAVSENELRHPASLTKVMTLYLLFEKLDRGDLSLDSRLSVSAHAASMAPTKLGLRPGSTIAVQDAIKAIVTKSANDMAVAVAERIGGDEDGFAQLMTRKAHALGMSRTAYVNASGLPDDRQLTTAHDLTVLGRAIRDDFPQYYHFFSIPSFTYAGSYMANHNHLMSRFEGMDGIKTGYTRASGFNLLSSVSQGGHRLVAVVMGGRSAGSRDNIMASLLESHIEEAAPTRTATTIVPSPIEAPSPTVQTASLDEVRRPERERGPSLIAPTLAVPPAPVARPNDWSRPVGQATASPVLPPERSVLPPERPVLPPERPVLPPERPRPAFIAGAPKIDPDRPSPSLAANDRRRLALDGSTSTRGADQGSATVALATATPSSLHWVTGPSGRSQAAMPVPRPARPVQTAKLDVADDHTLTETQMDQVPARGAHVAHGGWVIQIGATDAPDKATDLLARAKTEGRSALAAARPFTEEIKKGDATLYRARFAGLDTNEAEAACRTLKRSGFACFATKD